MRMDRRQPAKIEDVMARDARMRTWIQAQGATVGELPSVRSYADALRGTAEAGDFIPNQACVHCGAMPYWDGRRYAGPPHDMSKHPVDVPRGSTRDGPPVREADVAASIDRQMRRAGAVRRSTGERDDDDD
jgi:hypothetical protein